MRKERFCRRNSNLTSRDKRSSLEERKAEIVRLIGGAVSKISVSLDVWTSSNYISFFGVVAHFVSNVPHGRAPNPLVRGVR